MVLSTYTSQTIETFENGAPYQFNFSNPAWITIAGGSDASSAFCYTNPKIYDHQATVNTFTFKVPQATINAKLSFFHKVSSENGYDRFTVKINNVLEVNITGSTNWTKYEKALTPGIEYTVEFSYVKDGSSYAGADRGYIDNLMLSYDYQFEEGQSPFGIEHSTQVISAYEIDPTGNLQPQINFDRNITGAYEIPPFTSTKYIRDVTDTYDVILPTIVTMGFGETFNIVPIPPVTNIAVDFNEKFNINAFSPSDIAVDFNEKFNIIPTDIIATPVISYNITDPPVVNIITSSYGISAVTTRFSVAANYELVGVRYGNTGVANYIIKPAEPVFSPKAQVNYELVGVEYRNFSNATYIINTDVPKGFNRSASGYFQLGSIYLPESLNRGAISTFTLGSIYSPESLDRGAISTFELGLIYSPESLDREVNVTFEIVPLHQSITIMRSNMGTFEFIPQHDPLTFIRDATGEFEFPFHEPIAVIRQVEGNYDIPDLSKIINQLFRTSATATYEFGVYERKGYFYVFII